MPEFPQAVALGSKSPPARRTIHGLQALRFIAAVMVVVTHALNREVVAYVPAPLPRGPWLESGVDIFFVISGFIMVYIIRPETRPGAFWLQRFTRIAPLYWVATAVAFLGCLLLPDWFFGHQSLLFAVRSMVFMPLGDNAWAHPILSPGWTLIYEFAFYTVLALCMTVRRPPFLLAAALIGLNLVVGKLIGLPWTAFYADEVLMLEFLFGMSVAWLVARLPVAPWAGLGIAGLGLVAIFFVWDLGGVARGIKIGVPALVVVFGMLASEPLWQRHPALQRFAALGDASYSIYLVHFFFVSAIATLFQTNAWVRDAVGPYGFMALLVGTGIGAGLLAHHWVEKPLLRLARAWLPRRPAPAVPAAAKV